MAHPLVSKTLLPKLPTSSNCENDCRIDENDDIDPLVSERVTLICAMARFPFLARFYFFHVHTSLRALGPRVAWTRDFLRFKVMTGRKTIAEASHRTVYRADED